MWLSNFVRQQTMLVGTRRRRARTSSRGSSRVQGCRCSRSYVFPCSQHTLSRLTDLAVRGIQDFDMTLTSRHCYNAAVTVEQIEAGGIGFVREDSTSFPSPCVYLCDHDLIPRTCRSATFPGLCCRRDDHFLMIM